MQFSLIFLAVLLLRLLSGEAYTQTDVVPDAENAEMLSLVNKLRAQGCQCGSNKMPPAQPLQYHPKLAEAARKHAEDMAAKQYFSHRGKDGSTVGGRVRRTGLKWTYVGENIGTGYGSTKAQFLGWKSSPGHCRNMMNRNYDYVGMGSHNGYSVMVLANDN